MREYGILEQIFRMKRIVWFLLAMMVLGACGKKKKPSLSGEEPVEISDFIESYPLRKPAVNFSDTSVRKKDNDSLRISRKVFTQFIPDSIVVAHFGKSAKPRFYPLGRVEVPKGETYLFSKMVNGEKKIVLISAFDKDKTYGNSMVLFQQDKNTATSQQSNLDSRFVVNKTVQMTKADGTLADGKESFAYDLELKKFTLLMTEALDDRVREVINPIDTLPVKNKFSADYIRDKMNIVSIRDAGKPGRMVFFIHFENKSGDCKGEMRGEAKFLSANKAVYSKPGDPCQLAFLFTSTGVSLREEASCGNWRGLECAFEGSFPKKKTGRAKKK